MRVSSIDTIRAYFHPLACDSLVQKGAAAISKQTSIVIPSKSTVRGTVRGTCNRGDHHSPERLETRAATQTEGCPLFMISR